MTFAERNTHGNPETNFVANSSLDQT